MCHPCNGLHIQVSSSSFAQKALTPAATVLWRACLRMPPWMLLHNFSLLPLCPQCWMALRLLSIATTVSMWHACGIRSSSFLYDTSDNICMISLWHMTRACMLITSYIAVPMNNNRKHYRHCTNLLSYSAGSSILKFSVEYQVAPKKRSIDQSINEP